MEEDEDLEEISQFLDQQSGHFLSYIGQDLIQESYSNFWEDTIFQNWHEQPHQLDVIHYHEQVEQQGEEQRNNGLLLYSTPHNAVNLQNIPLEGIGDKDEAKTSNNNLLLEDKNESKKRFHCDKCPGTSYSRKSDLNRHIKEKHSKKVTEVPQFYCPYCATVFTRKQNCQRHLKKGCELAPSGISLQNLHKPLTSI